MILNQTESGQNTGQLWLVPCYDQIQYR